MNGSVKNRQTNRQTKLLKPYTFYKVVNCIDFINISVLLHESDVLLCANIDYLISALQIFGKWGLFLTVTEYNTTVNAG